MTVCATGDVSANTWQMGAADDVCSAQVADLLTGGQCDVYINTSSSCGATSLFGSGCQVRACFAELL